MSPAVRRSITDSVPCDRCKAEVGASCRSPAGQACEPHQTRVMADLFKHP